MKSFRDRNPYAVGIVTVLLLGTATGFAFMVGLLNIFERAYSMEGVFSDASGLREGDSVRLAGIKVGRVTDSGHCLPCGADGRHRRRSITAAGTGD